MQLESTIQEQKVMSPKSLGDMLLVQIMQNSEEISGVCPIVPVTKTLPDYGDLSGRRPQCGYNGFGTSLHLGQRKIRQIGEILSHLYRT